MHTEACQNRGVIKAFTATVRSAANNSAAQYGFTLVELLVGVALGSMVMSGLGTLMMLSEVRVSANIQRNFDVKDALNRTTDLMRREATFSSFFAEEVSGSVDGAGPLVDCRSLTQVRFAQRNNISSICYKAIAPSDLPDVYKAVYKGPCVLIRLGLPYKPNDDLDTSAASNVQVLMDGLAKPRSSCGHVSTFSVTLGATGSIGGVDSINRNANITITMDSPRVSYSYSVRSPSSPAYDGVALYRLCTSKRTSGCGEENSTIYHHKPSMTSMTEDFDFTTPEKENIFYFDYPYSEYKLSKDKDPASGPCTYSQCYVSHKDVVAVQLKYVDGLIFGDKEIRVFD
jgi:prepilin-type N-terminal cleavage/methylation domain-containing protein